MDDLQEKLAFAHKLCTELSNRAEKANALEREGLDAQYKLKRHKGLLGYGLYFLIAVFTGAILEAILPFLKIIGTIAGVFTGVYLYQRKAKALTAKLPYIEQAKAEREAAARILAVNQDALAFLPEDYWYPLATGYLLKMVETDRADTLREALAMLDEQLHRWKMEDAQAQILAEQQAQTALLREIHSDTSFTAVAAAAAAANS